MSKRLFETKNMVFLGTMAEVEVANNLEEFISSGRTGRRNAMADILDSKHASTSTAGIDLDMSGLKCSGNQHKLITHSHPFLDKKARGKDKKF